LGAAHANRLQPILEGVAELRYFSDSRDVTGYDLLARSAFVRLVLAHRKRFKELVMLTWSAGLSTASQAFVSTIGEPLELLTSNAEFDRRLALAAPQLRDAHNRDVATRAADASGSPAPSVARPGRGARK
jgi:hypothetical protein